MRSTYILATIALFPLVFPPAVAQTQGDSPAEAYSRGVRAYAAGRADQAEEQLTMAVEFAPQDPRPYYFRGLNRLAQGETEPAEADMAKAARLEAEQGLSAVVEQSLASVQGAARLTLERVRREARKNLEIGRRTEIAQQRRQARHAREERVLRTAYQLPLEALASRLTPAQAQGVAVKNESAVETVVAEAPEAESAQASNPFADDGTAASTAPPPTDAAASDDDPFAESPIAASPAAPAAPVAASPPAAAPDTPVAIEDLPEHAQGFAKFFRSLGSGDVSAVVGSLGGGAPMGGMGGAGGMPAGELGDDFDEGDFGDFGSEGFGDEATEGDGVEMEDSGPSVSAEGRFQMHDGPPEDQATDGPSTDQEQPVEGDGSDQDGFGEMEENPFEF